MAMASPHEKILTYHISRLSDRHPEVQLNAISELEAMGAGAEEAMDALKECFENSPDEAVQEAARQAAFNIFMAAKEAKETDES